MTLKLIHAPIHRASPRRRARSCGVARRSSAWASSCSRSTTSSSNSLSPAYLLPAVRGPAHLLRARPPDRASMAPRHDLPHFLLAKSPRPRRAARLVSSRAPPRPLRTDRLALCGALFGKFGYFTRSGGATFGAALGIEPERTRPGAALVSAGGRRLGGDRTRPLDPPRPVAGGVRRFGKRRGVQVVVLRRAPPRHPAVARPLPRETVVGGSL